jgi:2-keto-4-pentenoate hydratase/2-oxohepta-3-ene-1,7-dioic acid hydratase in catechol pathway
VEVVSTRRGLARVEPDHLALLDTPFANAGAVIRDTGSLDVLDSCAVVERLTREAGLPELLPPLGQPAALWGVGLNYRSKAEITGRPVPTEPILYIAASSSVAGPDQDLVLPADQVGQMDYEGEIALVIGRRLYQSSEEQVWDHIAAITAANDVTARDVMKATATPLLAKSFPGFSPLGTSVRSTVASDPTSIRLRTWVNGELRQDDDSTGMIFSVEELVARISWYCVLEPGDVVLTGTPAGTGQDGGCYLCPGDTVTVEVDGVLPLVSRVVAGSPAVQAATTITEIGART